MKKNVKFPFWAAAVVGLVAVVSGCASLGQVSSRPHGSNGVDTSIKKGIDSWNLRGPESAKAFWVEIRNPETKQQYLNYIDYYKKGEAALLDAESKTLEEEKLDSCNLAVQNFIMISSELDIPENISSLGVSLSAERITKLLEEEKVQEAKVLYANAYKAFRTDELSFSGREIEVVGLIASKKSELQSSANSAFAIKNLDDKINKLDILYSSYVTNDAAIAERISSEGVSSSGPVSSSQNKYRKVGQDIAIQREKSIRTKAYDYKEKITESFSKEAPKGSGKKGVMKYEELLEHYKNVQSEMNSSYNSLMALKSKYPKEINNGIIDEIESQKRILDSKIYEVNKELANEKEIASRGTPMTPLMIGLFNPDKNSTADNKKSRPAKFSSSNGKKDEYWWGMASIPNGQMNDLVITLKDSRTVRVFNQNTKSGKDIKSKKLTDLVSKSAKVGNSWPVLNAGSQLNGTNYYFEVQKDSAADYSGDVTIYSSFITKRR